MSSIFSWKFNVNLARIIFLMFLTWMEAECKGDAEQMSALHRILLGGYNPVVRPSRNYSNPTVVTVQLYVLSVLGLDLEKQLFFLRAELRVRWTDQYLQWDPQLFGDIDRVLMPQNSIWTPDIIRSSANDNDEFGSERLLVSITSEGHVAWNPPFFLSGPCKLEMSRYPFDVSVCPVVVYSSMSDNNTVTFRLPEDPIVLAFNAISGEYDISPAGATERLLERDDGSYEALLFNIRLARRPFYTVLSVLLPINLLAVISVVLFVMPPEESTKVDISMTVLLAFTVFLDVASDRIPHSSEDVSVLVVYISGLLTLSFLSVVGNVLVVAVRDWDAADDKEAAKLSIQQSVTAEDMTNKHNSFAETGSLRSSSSDLNKTLLTEKQTRSQLFHRTRAAKLNEAFLICACISLFMITLLSVVIFFT